LTPSLARSNPVIVKSTLIPDEKPQSEAVLTAQAKRQERLIKNRAAALLSRKRKREHISLLESHTDLLKVDNQDLKERVSELEENVKILTEERDSARQECERLHRQITVLTHRPHETRMDMDLERNLRTTDADRGLNSKATGVVFMVRRPCMTRLLLSQTITSLQCLFALGH
jgi:chromosome segregation ATPase